VVLNGRHVISSIVAYLHVRSVDYNSFINKIVNQFNIENILDHFLDLDVVENVAQPSIVSLDNSYVCNQFCCAINSNLCFQLTPWNHDMCFLLLWGILVHFHHLWFVFLKCYCLICS
jgi:hypothetical protein